jgi:hypothetical protein
MFPNATGPKSIIGSVPAFGKGQSYWQAACLKVFEARGGEQRIKVSVDIEVIGAIGTSE